MPTTTHLKVVVEEQEGQTTLLREVDMFAIRGRSKAQVPTSTHLKVVVEEQEGQTTLLREMGITIIRRWVQVTGVTSTHLRLGWKSRRSRPSC